MAKINILLLSVLVLSLNAEAKKYDITRFGARPGGGDASGAIVAAFRAACAAPTGGTIVVPKGVFFVNQVDVEGPCRGRVSFQNLGTINGNPDPAALKNQRDWISFAHIDRFVITGGGIFDAKGQVTWAQKEAGKLPKNQPTNLALSFCTNSKIKDVTIQNSKMFQVNLLGCTNVTVQRVTINAPYESPNTDGIHVGRSTDVKILDSTIMTGDDCVSIGDGSKQVLVQNVKCGPGHGIAVGSLGKYENEEAVDGILIKNCSLTNTENGLRVKTVENSVGAGVANGIHFEDITLTNVTYPINIDQEYCPSGGCGGKPSEVQISNLSFKGIRGTSATKEIVKLVCSKTMPCQNVEIGDIHITYSGPEKDVPLVHGANVRPRLTGAQVPAIIF